jgi:chromosome segregation protein
MYLAQLELQGFKSFANKTKVRFDSGITAIVGPNGCGKSNIVDALRWVLGEQRPSLLRSAAMTNVIFNGTAAKKALGMAEVSLTIINNRGVLPTEFTDITMTRRLYRSGESEYLINNKPCRLRDINDLFMDTGMGPNAYSVIELKMVDEILNDKNNDRRRLFEEAAGITKFKERKKQTLKKLSDTRADLQRMEDILVEVRKKTRSLQAQASRAERARKYQEELEFLDKAVSRQEYQNVRDELNPLLERIASVSSTREELQNRLEMLEKNEEEAHEELIGKERTQSEVRRKVEQISSGIQEIHTNMRVAEEKAKSEESVIRRYEQDIYQAETEIRDLRKNLKANEEELKQAEAELEKVRGELEASRTTLEESRRQVGKVREELDTAAGRHSEIRGRTNELQNLQVRLESRIENAEEQEQRLHRQVAEGREKATSFAREQEEMETRHSFLLQEYEDAEQQLEKARGEREQLQNRINQQKDEIRGLQSRRDALRSEYELLKGLAESSDAHPAGVQYLRGSRDEFSMLELVSDVFSIDEKHAAAVEAVLGDAANFVITANKEEAVRAFGLLRKKDKGRVTIIPLDRIPGGAESGAAASDGAMALSGLVTCEIAFEPLKQLFFGGVVLTESLEDAVRLASKHRVTAVTPDGDVASQNGFIYSGSSNKNAGVRIGLREKVERRRLQADEVSLELEKAQMLLDDLTESYRKFDLQQPQQHLRECSDRLRKHEARAESSQTQADFYQKNVHELEQRLQELKDTMRKAGEEKEQITPELEQLLSEMETVVRDEVSLKSALNEKEEILQRSQTRFNDVSLRFQNAENRVATLRRDIGRFESDVQGIKDRLNQRAEQAKSSKNQIVALREQLELAEDELREQLVHKETAEKEYNEAEEDCARQRGKINLLEENLKEARRKKDSSQELLYSLELAKSKLEMEQKNINDHVWETYNLTIDQIEQQLPEDTDISTAQETIFTLKQRLKNIGEVNPLAIKEYEEEQQRLDHFEEQISDLESAEEQLIETIQEINKNAQERFNRTFREIRENFRTVFNTLFEENDHCDLVIDEKAEDPLEAKIEITANPRGKRPSVIEQLSGGEKTLTAIALLFAIYLVKPSPFCVMDEVDAPLDDPNILRFTKLLRKFSNDTQFIVITHNKTTMEKSEMMYGVTMPEVGVSKLVGVRLDDVSANGNATN